MRNERGFTLIEVMMALVILATVILTLAASAVTFISTVTLSERREAAMQLVDGRIDQVQTFPVYAALDTAFGGTETGFPTLTGYARTTTITRVGGAGQPNDYKLVTVTVTGPGINTPVSRTIVIAAP